MLAFIEFHNSQTNYIDKRFILNIATIVSVCPLPGGGAAIFISDGKDEAILVDESYGVVIAKINSAVKE